MFEFSVSKDINYFIIIIKFENLKKKTLTHTYYIYEKGELQPIF